MWYICAYAYINTCWPPRSARRRCEPRRQRLPRCALSPIMTSRWSVTRMCTCITDTYVYVYHIHVCVCVSHTRMCTFITRTCNTRTCITRMHQQPHEHTHGNTCRSLRWCRGSAAEHACLWKWSARRAPLRASTGGEHNRPGQKGCAERRECGRTLDTPLGRESGQVGHDHGGE